MFAFKTFIPAAAILFISSANALGCYNDNGKGYNNLHGTDGVTSVDTYPEVENDIKTTCGIVAGKTFRRGDPPYTRCSTWEVYLGDETFNHIDWAIRLDDSRSDESLVMSYDKCVTALTRELFGCSAGSEQNNGGFFYRIDPQYGACGSQSPQ